MFAASSPTNLPLHHYPVHRTLIVNLPGRLKAIRECLDTVFPAVPYCIDLIGGLRLETQETVIRAFRPGADVWSDRFARRQLSRTEPEDSTSLLEGDRLMVTRQAYDQILRTYDQWHYCITMECGIPLTAAFIAQRLAALRNTQLEETQRFRRAYGDNHWQSVLAWFDRADREMSIAST